MTKFATPQVPTPNAEQEKFSGISI